MSEQFEEGLMPRKLWLTLLGLFCGSLGLLFVIEGTGPHSNPIWLEVSKSLIQLAVGSVFGAFVSLVMSEYQRQRAAVEKEREEETAREEYRDELLKSLLSRLIADFITVKKARRILRGQGLVRLEEGAESQVSGVVYDLQINALINVQLAFEELRRDVITVRVALAGLHWDRIPDFDRIGRTNPTKPETNPTPSRLIQRLLKLTPAIVLEHALLAMERYLDGLIAEFERERCKFTGEPPLYPLAQLKRLDTFLEQTPKSRYNVTFTPWYSRAQSILRAAIQHRKLPPAPMAPKRSRGAVTDGSQG